ncbi:hypothetical protein FIBSPDRAFT_810621 [Athelia psychrophila]|uniref:Velvet domain-containing protein n=1 Tax=Athelia psychrophila TaxID=1759441 RepID=A0A166W570_9AGAM|nr:hypothetical protein FIBSPDRAFT_810621 [Fibularhizoctonia sp. CBS 109695]
MFCSSGSTGFEVESSTTAATTGACNLCTGEPIYFTTGQFEGKTVRAELIEVQKAELGRKYARIDRRPLDPPPVVLLKLYIVNDAGTTAEKETEISDYEEVENIGLVCHVDLFPVSPAGAAPAGAAAMGTHNQFIPYTSADFARQNAERNEPAHRLGPAQDVPVDGSLSTMSCGFIEHSKCTDSLMGETFVQPICMDFQGRRALIAVFGDLAVRITGVFILRYRIFDVFSKHHPNDIKVPIHAECFGGPFRIYASKDFPGLPESTELTKALARWGVRVNVRATERKRRRKSSIAAASVKGKGKALARAPSRSEDDEDNDDEDN